MNRSDEQNFAISVGRIKADQFVFNEEFLLPHLLQFKHEVVKHVGAS